jgi:hypothetical protein
LLLLLQIRAFCGPGVYVFVLVRLYVRGCADAGLDPHELAAVLPFNDPAASSTVTSDMSWTDRVTATTAAIESSCGNATRALDDTAAGAVTVIGKQA